MVVLIIYIVLVYPLCVLSLSINPSFSRIPLPSGVTGADSVAMDPKGGGPYITIADGRILKYLGPAFGFVDFATTSPNRTHELCDGTVNPDLIFTCGRPIDLSFNRRTGDCYIVDAVHGLFVVGLYGGPATLLANAADGIPFKFLNGVDVDPITENVYFTAFSNKFDIRNITQPGVVIDSTGRLSRYNPKTGQVTVLLRGLSAPTGPAVSLDGSFVVLSESGRKRVLRYWIRGLRENTLEVLLNVTGNPNNIKRTPLGEFWVPVNVFNAQTQSVTPLGLRFNIFGRVVQQWDLSNQYFNQNITTLNEQNGALRVGSRTVGFIGVYQ